MAKNKNDYFALLQEQVNHCVRAADLLQQILSAYTAETMEMQQMKMHEIEHSADEVHHSILAKLSVEFITPIDQEDILSLVQIIDDVTDALDEVVLACYMFHISELPPHIPELAAIVCRCVGALRDAVAELKNFKKPQHLRELLVQINSIESEADAVYAKAIHTLFATTDDTKRILGCKAVCEDLEHCCDLCEHAADVIDHIILKNT